MWRASLAMLASVEGTPEPHPVPEVPEEPLPSVKPSRDVREGLAAGRLPVMSPGFWVRYCWIAAVSVGGALPPAPSSNPWLN